MTPIQVHKKNCCGRGSKSNIKRSGLLLSPSPTRHDSNDFRAAIEGIMKEKGSSFINEHDVLHEVKQELTDYEEDLGEED